MNQKVKAAVVLLVAVPTLLSFWLQSQALLKITQMEEPYLYPGLHSGPALPVVPDCQQTSRPKLAIYVHSGSALHEQRALQRQKHNIPHHFVVGLPSFDNRTVDRHSQGQLPSETETKVAEMLLNEQERYGDILVTPHRDYYRDLNEKLMGVIRFGVEAGVEYIVKSDDDRCVNISAFHATVRQHEEMNKGEELYAGVAFFRTGDEYSVMKGPHGERAPFASGQIIILSRGLARIIVGPDWMYNILKAYYGTSSDDANLGKMIGRAKKIHNVSIVAGYDPSLRLCEILKERSLDENMIACHTRAVFE